MFFIWGFSLTFVVKRYRGKRTRAPLMVFNPQKYCVQGGRTPSLTFPGVHPERAHLTVYRHGSIQ